MALKCYLLFTYEPGVPTPYWRDFMVEILGNPAIESAVAHQQTLIALAARPVEYLIDTVPWKDMTPDQRKMCIVYSVSQVESQEELERRLERDFGISACVSWHQPDPNDRSDMEAKMLVQALGGLISKSGAMVMIMTHYGSF